jgi:hypothetical protein
MPHVLKRIEAVRKFRIASKSVPTRKLAETPTRFHTEFIPKGGYIALPQVSSERRNYIPIAFLGPDVLCGDKLRVIENATLFHFGVLTSQMHMAWTRYTCGRLKSDYQYSALVVYNNFPWPFCEQKTEDASVKRWTDAIEKEAQAVLDARARFPDATLADLYDPLTMPPELLKAHQRLDAAVDAAYAAAAGGKKRYASDAERVAFLFGLYQRLDTALAPTLPAKPARRPKKAIG